MCHPSSMANQGESSSDQEVETTSSRGQVSSPSAGIVSHLGSPHFPFHLQLKTRRAAPLTQCSLSAATSALAPALGGPSPNDEYSRKPQLWDSRETEARDPPNPVDFSPGLEGSHGDKELADRGWEQHLVWYRPQIPHKLPEGSGCLGRKL